MNYIATTYEEAMMIKGQYGSYCGIDPLKISADLYIFPEDCLSETEFAEVFTIMNAMLINVQSITKASDVTSMEYNVDWSSVQFTISPSDSDLYVKMLKYSLITYFVLVSGTYKASQLYFNNTDDFITILGVGSDTIIEGWDFINNVGARIITTQNFSNIRFEALTIRDLLLNHKDWTDLTGRKIEFVNVWHDVTISSSGGYLCYLFCPGLEINISNYVLTGGGNIYAGIWFLAGKVTIDGCAISGFSKPFVIQGVETLNIKTVSTLGGITGIFFGANKTRPLDNFVVEDCIADGASEECLSFDTYGDNVSLNPCIAELSAISASIVDTKLKIYCDARTIEGTHPDEYYQNYSFVDHEGYLERFYVYFSQLSGISFAGQVVKVLEAGEDEGGQYIIADTSTDPATLTLNDYKSISIIGGFFNGTVKNNIIRNGAGTGLALFCSIFNTLVEGNNVTNCPVNGSYLTKALMLAKGVWNGANGNKIRNNNFEDGFKINSSYGTVNGYNNEYTGNTGAFEYVNEIDFVTDEV